MTVVKVNSAFGNAEQEAKLDIVFDDLDCYKGRFAEYDKSSQPLDYL